jgi:hypothetical protein
MNGCFLQVGDLRSAKTPQTVSVKKRRDPGGDAGKESTADLNGENGSVVPMVMPGAETKPKDITDIGSLREQIDELQKELLEKEEALRSAENTVSEMNAVYSTIDELRRQVSEKEALIKYTNSQLHNVKVNFGLPACPNAYLLVLFVILFSVCHGRCYILDFWLSHPLYTKHYYR